MQRIPGLILCLFVTPLFMSGCAVKIDENGVATIPGWARPFALPVAAMLRFIHDDVFARVGLESYGLAIILLTTLITVILLLPRRKQAVSLAKVQMIQPTMKKLQETYKTDRETLAKKQMDVYKKYDVNPAQGCAFLPVQLLLLTAMYMAVVSLGSELSEPFLWIPDLSFPHFGTGLRWIAPFTLQHLASSSVWPYLLLPAIYLFIQITTSYQINNPMSSTLFKSINILIILTVTGFATLIVPAAVIVYWCTSSFTQAISERAVMRHVKRVTNSDILAAELLEDTMFQPHDPHELFGPSDMSNPNR